MKITDEELRSSAGERVKKRRDFSAHLAAYVVVNAMLIGIWAISGGGYFWPAWVLLGWGIGLALNLWDVYFRRPITRQDIDDEVKRLSR
jgi:2TM domain